MDPNPYTPPVTDVRDPIAGPTRPIRGIVFAFVFDVVGTIVAVSILYAIYAIYLARQGLGQTAIETIIQSNGLDTAVGVFSTIIGLGFSYFSGQICIRVSRGKTLRYPYVLAGINAVFGLVTAFSSTEVGTMLFLSALSVGAVLLGATHALKNYANPT